MKDIVSHLMQRLDRIAWSNDPKVILHRYFEKRSRLGSQDKRVCCNDPVRENERTQHAMFSVQRGS